MTTEERLPNEIIITTEKLIELIELELDYEPELQETINVLNELVDKYQNKIQEMEDNEFGDEEEQ
jgi:hypothetical protein|tara:strand:- start:2503 stop:2697 length:195 start_codon:yes stop_codon:yes gene_type:complete